MTKTKQTKLFSQFLAPEYEKEITIRSVLYNRTTAQINERKFAKPHKHQSLHPLLEDSIINNLHLFRLISMHWNSSLLYVIVPGKLIHICIFQVTCRSVGIGSYLVRLGQRVIQTENSHLILTGYSALNKVCFYTHTML